MKIRKRQNRLYELFNGRNRVRYLAISIAQIYLTVILFLYNICNSHLVELNNIVIKLSIIILIRIYFKNFLKRFYQPRFNPELYYSFVQTKFNFKIKKFKFFKLNFSKRKFLKHKSKDLKLNKAIILTKKYIDRHYNHDYNADVLLSRLKNVKSKYEILTQLPSNYIIGVVTGAISGILTSTVLNNNEIENVASTIFNGFMAIIINIVFSFIALILLYFAIKSFYSEYDSIIMPYEIEKIKQKLSEIDDIYSI